MKVLHLRRPLRCLGQSFLGRVKAPCRVMTSVSSLRTTVTDLGPWPVRNSSNVLAASAICWAIVELDLSIASSLVMTIIGRQSKKKPA